MDNTCTLILKDAMPPHMASVLWLFKETGCRVNISGKSIKIKAPSRLCRVPTVRSLVYPGFPTDAGPIATALLSKADGTSVFVENIFENRFRYVDELKRFGAKIKTEGKIAVIEGVERLSAADCKSTDLRGGAAIVIAALAAVGESRIGEIHHIDRGYDDITGNLAALGAQVKKE